MNAPGDQHLIDILYKYFLDLRPEIGYNIRWDVYLTSSGYIREFVYMAYKTETERQRILATAREKANKLKDTKLWKILK